MGKRKYNTEEERKEAKRLYDKIRNAKPENKAKAKARDKARQQTPEAKAKAKAKRDTPEVKAKAKIRSAEYRAKNREFLNAKSKAAYESKKDGLFRVYMLPCGYVGQTSNVYNRMKLHRNEYNRDTSNYIIMHECETVEEAIRLERIYHALNFKGMHPFSTKLVDSVFK